MQTFALRCKDLRHGCSAQRRRGLRRRIAAEHGDGVAYAWCWGNASGWLCDSPVPGWWSHGGAKAAAAATGTQRRQLMSPQCALADMVCLTERYIQAEALTCMVSPCQRLK